METPAPEAPALTCAGIYPLIPCDVPGLIVTGLSKGGTSVVGDVIRQTARAWGPPECGALLTPPPRFGLPEPYLSHLAAIWSLPASFDAGYRANDGFEELSRFTRCFSPFEDTRERPCIDKLPAYLPCLPRVLERASGTPVLVVLRGPVRTVGSSLRSGLSLEEAVHQVLIITAGLVAVARQAPYNRSIQLLRLDDLVRDP